MVDGYPVREAGVTPAALRAIMTQGGCTPTTPPPRGTVIVLTAPDGSTDAYDCGAISQDSMLRLAEIYRTRARPATSAPGAQATEGYWDWEGYWREYCWVNGSTGETIECGIWRYEERPVWVRGPDGMDPTGYPPGEADGPGSGPGDSPDVPPPDPWCPSEDPDCWRLPSEQEKALFRNVQQYLRPSSQISDPTARQQCAMVAGWLEEALATMNNGNSSKIWVGTSNEEPRPRHHLGETEGQGKRFHLDPEIIDSATNGRNQIPWRKELLALLLHEAAHLTPHAVSHPRAKAVLGTNPNPIPPAWELYQNDLPFNYIHSERTATACVAL
jgi:hypothetical protein